MAAPIGNKFALGLDTSGRPPAYDNPKDLYINCNEYFIHCIDNTEKITITGLALFLGFCSRNTLYEYGKKEEFKDIIKRACLVVENSYETNGGTIDIFALKNMGWIDRTDLHHGGQPDNPIQTKNEHRFIIEDMSDGSETKI